MGINGKTIRRTMGSNEKNNARSNGNDENPDAGLRPVAPEDRRQRCARLEPCGLRVAAGLGLGRPPLKSLDFLALFCSAAPHHDPDLAERPAADHRGEGAVDVDWRFRVGFVRAVWLRSGGLASFGRFGFVRAVWLRSGGLASFGRLGFVWATWLRSSSPSPSCRRRDGARRTRPCLNR